MCRFVIMKDGKYVAPSGQDKSYTPRLQAARIYKTRRDAEADRCGDEKIVPLAPTHHKWRGVL